MWCTICCHWPFIWRWIFSLKNILNLSLFFTQSCLKFWFVDYFFDALLVRNVWKTALFLLSFQDWGQKLHMLLRCWPAACVWFLIEAFNVFWLFSTSAVRLRVLIWPSSNVHVKNVLSGLITDTIKCVNYVRLIALYRNIGSYFIFILLRLRVLIKQEIPPLLNFFLYLLTGARCCLSTGCPKTLQEQMKVWHF